MVAPAGLVLDMILVILFKLTQVHAFYNTLYFKFHTCRNRPLCLKNKEISLFIQVLPPDVMI